MSSLFDTGGLVRILSVGPLAYIAIIVLLRASGKRALSKMNAFDFVVTVALGSLLATIVIDDKVSLVEGVAALAVLLVGQFVITFLSTRTKLVQKLVKADPALVYSRGAFLDDALRRERVSRDEVLMAVRNAGYGSAEDVDAVVLETDGSFSVLTGVSSPQELPYLGDDDGLRRSGELEAESG